MKAETPKSKLKLAITASILPDGEEKAGDITKPYLELISTKLDLAPIECVFPSDDLKEIGKKLVEGKEYQIALVWGIECGWLQKEHKDIRILAVPIMGKTMSASSLILVRNEPATANFKLGSFTGEKPFRLATYRRESLITRKHRSELKKKYRQAFDDSAVASKSISQCLINVDNGKFDGVLVDEYTLFRLQTTFKHAMTRFRLEKDWGNLKKPLVFAPPTLVCSKKIVDDLVNGGFPRLQKCVLDTQHEKEGEESLKGWNATGIVAPDRALLDEILYLSNQFSADEF